MRYGGHTPCLDVRLADGSGIIFDAGTGLRPLGSALLAQSEPVNTHLFFSHMHWDYIQGLPFFAPAYAPSSDLTLLGPVAGEQSLEEMDATETHQASYAHYLAHVCFDEQLRPCDRSGVAAIIEYGMRRVADQAKLTSQFGAIAGLLREANYIAAQDPADAVQRTHVEQALQARRFRANWIEEKLRDMIAKGTVLIDTDGSKAGQVNGLTVLQFGDHTFG